MSASRFDAVVGARAGQFVAAGCLSDRDVACLQAFMVREDRDGDLLATRAGKAAGFGFPMGVLWLRGWPVAHLQTYGTDHENTKAFILPGDGLLTPVREWLVAQRADEASGRVTVTVETRSFSYTLGCASDLGGAPTREWLDAQGDSWEECWARVGVAARLSGAQLQTLRDHPM